ncbi:hypothetical protein [Streptosporangium sp. NBC_01469]|uniref:hypothetical protein n=1 Tax=Streptosporangium sp. NBC_01469 TaxID=2903898 RepID=UPI002E2C9CCB|nr:hypothetical protein [Streptosporangium sp. NBC_01469]
MDGGVGAETWAEGGDGAWAEGGIGARVWAEGGVGVEVWAEGGIKAGTWAEDGVGSGVAKAAPGVASTPHATAPATIAPIPGKPCLPCMNDPPYEKRTFPQGAGKIIKEVP